LAIKWSNIMMQKQVQAPDNPYLEMALEGARNYHRQRHLPALLALWPSELDDFSLAGTREIVGRLETALQAERRRSRARHWCYDLNRHLALVSALTGEQRHLATLGKNRGRVKARRQPGSKSTNVSK
jgi:Family of unknown function (DUF6477)